MTKILAIASSPSPTGDIIFVHGLGGSAIETWGFGRGNSWQDWIQINRPDLNIWSIHYEVEPSEWYGSAMPLSDRALNILALLDNRRIGSRPIIFIGHSMGGLLIKELLRHALTVTPRFKRVAESTKAVIFFATPHTGSSLSDIATFFSFLVRPSVAVSEMASQQPRLKDLNLWFRNNYAALGLKTCIFYETLETLGVRVVNDTSADPGIPLISPIPITANHITITKPESYDDIVVGQTLQTIDEAIPNETCRYDPERKFKDLGPPRQEQETIHRSRDSSRNFLRIRLPSWPWVASGLAVLVTLAAVLFWSSSTSLPTVKIDRDIYVGHYIGLPRIIPRLTINNPSSTRVQFVINNVQLVSPDDTKQYQLTVEGIFSCNGSVPTTIWVVVEPKSSSVCVFGIGKILDFGWLAQRVNEAAAKKGGFTPGPRDDLIEGPLLNELVATATSNFVWTPGEWKLRLDYSMSDVPQTKKIGLSISEADVRQLKALFQYYSRGYGVYSIWRDLTPDGTQPLRQVTATDLPN